MNTMDQYCRPKALHCCKARKTLDCLGWFRASRRSRAVTNMYKTFSMGPGHGVL
jgi:hypothetical protein